MFPRQGVVTAARAKDVEIQIMVGEMPVLVTDLPPPSTMINPLSYFVINPSSPNFSNYLLVQSSVSLAMKYGWDGYNVDDEAYGSPRKAKFDCLMWKAFVEDWARSLQCAGLVLTADIQFMSNMDIINMTDYLSTSFVDKVCPSAVHAVKWALFSCAPLILSNKFFPSCAVGGNGHVLRCSAIFL